MFRGRHFHTIDPKGRLSVPAKYRDLLNERDTQTLVLTEGNKTCVWAYPLDEWEALEATWTTRSDLTPEARNVIRVAVASAKECPVDRAGRTLVPPELRSFAHLDKNVVIVGWLKRFEIWDRERWSEVYDESRGRFDERSLAEAGL
jgi:MraZ protein